MLRSLSNRPAVPAAACLTVALLSLLVAQEPAYDPQAWLIWGRQISEGTLQTIAGPSWKPLPIVVTAPAALLGDDPAPLAWLVVARAAGLAALVLAYRLAARFGGPAAGAVAVLALLLVDTLFAGVARGNSEGLLIALVLLAISRQLDGRPRQAFGLGVAAALLRPEAWPLLAAHGLWLLHEQRRRSGAGVPWRTLVVLCVCAAGILAAWLVPEKLGSGDFLRAASRAREPVPDSPAQADRPFVAVFANSVSALAYPVYAGALVAVLDAWRTRRRGVLAIAAIAGIWMITVAGLAEGGFTGNLRYVMPPASLLCVLAGIGWAAAARRLGSRSWALWLAIAASVPGVVLAAGTFEAELRRTAQAERFYGALPAAIAAAGGEAAVKRCGKVLTGPFQTQALAWELHMHQVEVGLRGAPPGIIFAGPSNPLAGDERYPRIHATRPWIVRSACRGT